MSPYIINNKGKFMSDKPLEFSSKLACLYMKNAFLGVDIKKSSLKMFLIGFLYLLSTPQNDWMHEMKEIILVLVGMVILNIFSPF